MKFMRELVSCAASDSNDGCLKAIRSGLGGELPATANCCVRRAAETHVFLYSSSLQYCLGNALSESRWRHQSHR